MTVRPAPNTKTEQGQSNNQKNSQMDNFQGLTIGYQSTVRGNGTGSLVHKLESFEQLRELAKDKVKDDLPATFAFFGRRGNEYFAPKRGGNNLERISELVELYKSEHDCEGLIDCEVQDLALRHYGEIHLHGGSNVVQVDVDTTLFTTDVMKNADELNELCEDSVVLVQPSFSGKLHIILHTRYITDIDEYKREAAIVTTWVCKAIEKITGTNPFEVFDENGKCCVDVNGVKPSQALYFSDNDYIEFKDSYEFVITDEQRERTAESAGLLFQRVFADKVDYVAIDPFEGKFEITNPHKIKVTRKYAVGNYTGNDVRMQYANVLLWYCRGDMKQFRTMCKQLFVNYKEFSPVGDKNPNILFKGAFDREFGIVVTEQTTTYEPTSPEGILIPKGHWLSEYGDEIEQALATNRQIEVVAPTGTGKTVYISEYARRHKTLIVVPFNSQLVNYEKDWVNIVTMDKKSFKKNMSNVAVFDQAVKHFETLDKTWTVVVDEAHLLWCDRSWREAATNVVAQIRYLSDSHKIMLFTATDTIERKLFGIDRIVRFTCERSTVTCKWMDVTNPYTVMEKLIADTKKTCIFTDRYAQMLAMNLTYDFGGKTVTLCHSRTTDEKYQQVLEEQQLVSKVTISTKILYSGNNFNNEEPVRVVVQIDKNYDHSYIIQAIGRFRRCEDLEVFILNDLSDHEKQGGDDVLKTERELKRMEKQGSNIAKVMLTRTDIDDDYYNADAAAELERYYAKIDKNYIIDQLCRTGYLRVIDCGVCSEEKEAPVNKLKRQRSNDLVQRIRDNAHIIHRIIKEDKEDDVDTAGWKSALRNLAEDHIDAKSMARYITLRSENSSVMMDTIIRELYTIVNIQDLTPDEINKIKTDYKKFAQEETEGCSKGTKDKVRTYTCFLHRILAHIELEYPSQDFAHITPEEMIFVATEVWEKEKIRIKASASASGRLRAEPFSIRWVGGETLPDIDGLAESFGVMTFPCKGDCMRFLKCSSRTFSKFIKGTSKLNKVWEPVEP